MFPQCIRQYFNGRIRFRNGIIGFRRGKMYLVSDTEKSKPIRKPSEFVRDTTATELNDLLLNIKKTLSSKT